MTPDARERNYRDPVDPFADGDVDLDDPLERASIAMHRLVFETAPDVAGKFTGTGEQELVYTWAALPAGERRRYRLMADVVVRAHRTPRGDFLL